MRHQFAPICHPLSMLGRGVLLNSAYLYVVILVIKCAIYALYVDFLLFWLHLSSNGIHHPSQTSKEATP